MREFKEDDDKLIKWMTERGHTIRHMAKVFECTTMDIIKRQYWLRQTGRLKV